MILDNLGIIVKVGDANKRYASILGKTSNELTDAEKKMAFLNATIEAGEDLMGRLGKQTKSSAAAPWSAGIRWWRSKLWDIIISI